MTIDDKTSALPSKTLTLQQRTMSFLSILNNHQAYSRERLQSLVREMLDAGWNNPIPPETGECHIRPHDFCSAGTCKVCIDAARYRIVRVSRLTGDVLAHQLDEACDALLRSRNAPKASEESSCNPCTQWDEDGLCVTCGASYPENGDEVSK